MGKEHLLLAPILVILLFSGCTQTDSGQIKSNQLEIEKNKLQIEYRVCIDDCRFKEINQRFQNYVMCSYEASVGIGDPVDCQEYRQYDYDFLNPCATACDDDYATKYEQLCFEYSRGESYSC